MPLEPAAKPLPLRILGYVRAHPGDAVAPIVVAGLATITLLDLLGALTLSTATLTRAAVFVICTFAIGQLAEQVQRQVASDRRDDVLATLVASQKRFKQPYRTSTDLRKHLS